MKHDFCIVLIALYLPSLKRIKWNCLLSSMHKTGVIDNNHPKKLPEIIKDYNSSKCGVDTADQMWATSQRITATEVAGRSIFQFRWIYVH